MIIGFIDGGLEDLFYDGTSKNIDKKLHRNCSIILDALNGATQPRDLVGIKNFHPLKGGRAGYYSMHVNGNWCITFRFDKSDVTDINFEDYH